MIRSSKVSLKFSNTGKKSQVLDFLIEYKRVLVQFVDLLWKLEKIPTLLPKEITSQVDSWLSARSLQCCGKQASGIVRGSRRKQEKAQHVIKKLNQDGKFKQARKLKAIYDKKMAGKPSIERIEAELDSRFVKIDFKKNNSFDGWITISNLGRKIKLELPFKTHSHLNKMLNVGNIKTGIKLSNDLISLVFELPDLTTISVGKTIGIDVGQKTTLSVSDGQKIEQDVHGHTYQSICQKMAGKKKGSIGFRKTDTHRTNYLHWCVNRLELNGVRRVNLEKIKYLRRGKCSSRSLGHWNYGELFDILKGKLHESGVQINEVSPTYTSQRCSKCGWTRKGNRKLKQFKCDKCGHSQDADLNASINLSLDLSLITKKERLTESNRKGFYWIELGQEPTVPGVQEVLWNVFP
jgi:IS605 OrfB family transposase